MKREFWGDIRQWIIVQVLWVDATYSYAGTYELKHLMSVNESINAPLAYGPEDLYDCWVLGLSRVPTDPMTYMCSVMLGNCPMYVLERERGSLQFTRCD